MKILVAPDSFKGSLTAAEAARAMSLGLKRVWREAEIEEVPLADGGEGTAAALVAATGGKMVQTAVHGPTGRRVMAAFGLLGDGRTAVVEMAAAAGLLLLDPAERNPAVTTTYGVGQLIKAALDLGCRKIIVGIGGSATNDGGAGMAAALGAKLTDAEGRELSGGGALGRLARIDVSGLDHRLAETEIIIASDVDNPLCGPEGAAAVYGPQKGATPEMVKMLDANLAHYAVVLAEQLGRDVAGCPGAGAAGGLGAGLMAFAGGRRQRGIDVVMDAAHLEKRLQGKDLAFTGEGSLDEQTLRGKVPQGVAALAHRCGVPVIAVAGNVGSGMSLTECGLAGAISITPGPMGLAEAVGRAGELAALAAERAARLIELGRTMPRNN